MCQVGELRWFVSPECRTAGSGRRRDLCECSSVTESRDHYLLTRVESEYGVSVKQPPTLPERWAVQGPLREVRRVLPS